MSSCHALSYRYYPSMMFLSLSLLFLSTIYLFFTSLLCSLLPYLARTHCHCSCSACSPSTHSSTYLSSHRQTPEQHTQLVLPPQLAHTIFTLILNKIMQSSVFFMIAVFMSWIPTYLERWKLEHLLGKCSSSVLLHIPPVHTIIHNLLMLYCIVMIYKC